uniref:Uncharacterized protein n=1 Tax=Arundo donax TaxID=35708 RepID=A0A0A9A4W8_ARUDO
MDWSRELLRDGGAVIEGEPPDLTENEASSELSLAGASSAFVVAISAAVASAGAVVGCSAFSWLVDFTLDSGSASEGAKGSGRLVAGSSTASLLT